MPVAAKMRATESSVPSPPRTIDQRGFQLGHLGALHGRRCGGVLAALQVQQRLVAVPAQPVDQLRQQPGQLFLLRL